MIHKKSANSIIVASIVGLLFSIFALPSVFSKEYFTIKNGELVRPSPHDKNNGKANFQYYPILEAAKADPHKAVGGVW